MKRKIFTLCTCLVACICLIFGLVACGDDEEDTSGTSIDGTYYLYAAGEIDDSASLTLNGGKYSLKNVGGVNSEGDYAVQDTSIRLRPAGSGTNSSAYIFGTVSNGQIALTISGRDYLFVSSASLPGSGTNPGSGSNPGSGTNPGGTASGITVTFHANGGTFGEEEEEPVETFALNVAKGTALEFPEPPTKASYEFAGWYRDELCEAGEYEEGQTVNSAFDLYAKWELAEGEREVRFYPYVGAEMERHATYNGRVTYIPEREGYIFNGWWLGTGSSNGDAYVVTQRWDMNARVTGNLELYGTWIAEEDEVRKLSAPTLRETNGVFTWDAVEGATGYEIGYSDTYDNFTTATVQAYDTLRWEFPSWEEVGYYAVHIRSLGDGIHTVNSNYATAAYSHRILAQTSIFFDQTECVLSWTKVPNADSYTLTIDGDEITHIYSYENTTYDMSSYEAGEHTVTVVAEAGSYRSSTTNSTFTKYRLKTAAPEELLQKDGSDWNYILTWDEVAHADKYEVYLNGEWTESIYEPYYEIPQTLSAWTEGEEEGAITFEVVAQNEDHDFVASGRSESITLTRLYNLSLRSAGEEDLTVYGHLPVPMEYEVSFDGNLSDYSVSNVPYTQTVSGTRGLSYPSDTPSASSHIFRGWYTEPECENLYDFSAPVTHDFTLYAGWYTISYSGYNSYIIDLREHKTVDYQCSYSTSSTSSSNAIYVYFTALTSGTYYMYYRNSSGSSSSYTTAYALYNAESSGYSIFSDQTYYSASYTRKSFTATAGDVYYLKFYRYNNSSTSFQFYFTGDFDPADGGKSGEMYQMSLGTVTAEAAVPARQDISITAPSYSSDGTNFAGWYEGDTLVSQDTTYNFTMPAEDKVYWARYENDYLLNVTAQYGGSIETGRNYVNVSFNLNGAAGEAPATQKITGMQTLTYPEIPTRSDGNYLFGGWYTDDSCTGDPFDFSAKLTADVTLYAKWVSYSGADTIDINGNVSTYVSGSSTSSNNYYAFVPLVSGEIMIYSSASFDTKGYLFDSGKSQLTSDDDGLGSNQQFKITYQVTAGQLYYIVATAYNSSGASGNVTIYLSGAAYPAEGGIIDISVAAWDTDEAKPVRAGTQITLHAVPDYGYEFDGWYEGDSLVCAEEEYIFSVENADRNLVARFRSIY